jgi:predicted metal-binding protein
MCINGRRSIEGAGGVYKKRQNEKMCIKIRLRKEGCLCETISCIIIHTERSAARLFFGLLPHEDHARAIMNKGNQYLHLDNNTYLSVDIKKLPKSRKKPIKG